MVSLIESNGDFSQLSGAERLKAESKGLYGALPEDLAQPVDHFSEEGAGILKFHGAYQEDDRDARKERKKLGQDKLYYMMVRTKFGGGKITPEQYIWCDEFASRYGQNDMRATSRQDIQFHGVPKSNLRRLLHDLNVLAHISTLGACGDVVRNTMASPVADIDPRYVDLGFDAVRLAQEINEKAFPKTQAYYELWINDHAVHVNPDGSVRFDRPPTPQEEEDPLYGKTYLPRKFKIAIGADFDNSVDLYTNDVGIMAVTDHDKVIGFEILAGGGLGFSHGREKTYPRLADHVAFVSYDEIWPIVEAIIHVQRDWGDRTDRRQARLKYTVDRLGLETFVGKIYEYAGRTFAPPRGVKPNDHPDFLGWHKQSQPGLNYVGVWVECGRIKDYPGSHQFKSGLRRIVEKFRVSVRITPDQNLILANIHDEDVGAVQNLLDEFSIPTDQNLPRIRRKEMACVALPLCNLATTEAERVMPEVMRGLVAAGFGDEDVVIRMTGCPNGCARSSACEIGLIGKGTNRYVLAVGGDYLGTRLNQVLYPSIEFKDIVPTIGKLLTLWKTTRKTEEHFGDWAHRVGMDYLRQQLENGVSTNQTT